MEEVRANVEDVEVRCKAIHVAAARVGIRLDRVAITEERTVNVCSHHEHQPSVSTRWRIEMEPCRVTERTALVKIRDARLSAGTLDGLAAQAVDVFKGIAPASAPECPCSKGPAAKESSIVRAPVVFEGSPNEDAKL